MVLAYGARLNMSKDYLPQELGRKTKRLRAITSTFSKARFSTTMSKSSLGKLSRGESFEEIRRPLSCSTGGIPPFSVVYERGLRA